MVTLRGVTLKVSRIASAICTLLASGATLKTYTPPSLRYAPFSVMRGAMSICEESFFIDYFLAAAFFLGAAFALGVLGAGFAFGAASTLGAAALPDTFSDSVSNAALGSAITKYLADRTCTGLRSATEPASTWPMLAKDFKVGMWRSGRTIYAAFLDLLKPEKCLPMATNIALAAAALGVAIAIESIKITSPSLYFLESVTKRAFWRMERFTLSA